MGILMILEPFFRQKEEKNFVADASAFQNLQEKNILKLNIFFVNNKKQYLY